MKPPPVRGSPRPDRRSSPPPPPRPAALALAALAFTAGLLAGRASGPSPRSAAALPRAAGAPPPPLARAARVPSRGARPRAAPTLVTFVVAPTDAAAADNLRFFVDHGLYGGVLGADLVAAAAAAQGRPATDFFYDDGADAAIIVQGGADALASAPPAASAVAASALRKAASHPRATVHHRPNACYDWGAWGWALEAVASGGAGAARPHHRFFVLVNASVRGPFVPPSAHAAATAAVRAATGNPAAPRAVVSWHALLTALLGGPGDVRAAGPVISCEGTPAAGGDAAGGGWAHSPHVQSWALATDRVGLAAWRAAGARNPLRCHADRWAAVADGEVGASAVLLAAGHGLASLLPRYAGVDWRNGSIAATAHCNQRAPPTGDGRFDGTTLPPTETLFVKHKAPDAAALAGGGPGTTTPWLSATARAGLKASAWADQALQGARDGAAADVASNEWVDGLASHRAPGVGGLPAALGPACFDAPFYTSAHADLASLKDDPAAAWSHALHFGQFEGRAMRGRCVAGDGAAGSPALPPPLLAAQAAAHGVGQTPLEPGVDRRAGRVGWVEAAAPRRAGVAGRKGGEGWVA